MNPDSSDSLFFACLDTPLGPMKARWGEAGLRSLDFAGMDEELKTEDGSARDGLRRGDGSVSVASTDATPGSPAETLVQRLAAELGEYFAGSRDAFDIPLDPRGTAFQERVWRQLLDIPYGAVMSYAEQAVSLGDPKAVRASASANGKNPIAILIPCHRVTGSDGSLTGYAGGLWRKRFLLELESRRAEPTLPGL